ncbi:MAG: class I SAM-dependent methyltransferase [Acidimicrobiales bacterium]
MGLDGLSFGRVADLYDAIRPSPPPQLATLLAPVEGLDVLDLAAGTGLVTRFLDSLGARVTAVEPDARMRDVLARSGVDVAVLDGTAEAIPLADASVDVVVASSSWHWFRQPDAAREIARVLRDRGRLFVLANTLDRSVGWVARLRSLPDEGRDHRTARRAPQAAPDLAEGFCDVRNIRIPWTWRRSPDELVALMRTYSVVLQRTDDERRVMDERIRVALTRRAREGVLDVPMVLSGVSAHRRARGNGTGKRAGANA